MDGWMNKWVNKLMNRWMMDAELINKMDGWIRNYIFV